MVFEVVPGSVSRQSKRFKKLKQCVSQDIKAKVPRGHWGTFLDVKAPKRPQKDSKMFETHDLNTYNKGTIAKAHGLEVGEVEFIEADTDV